MCFVFVQRNTQKLREHTKKEHPITRHCFHVKTAYDAYGRQTKSILFFQVSVPTYRTMFILLLIRDTWAVCFFLLLLLLKIENMAARYRPSDCRGKRPTLIWNARISKNLLFNAQSNYDELTSFLYVLTSVCVTTSGSGDAVNIAFHFYICFCVLTGEKCRMRLLFSLSLSLARTNIDFSKRASAPKPNEAPGNTKTIFRIVIHRLHTNGFFCTYIT